MKKYIGIILLQLIVAVWWLYLQMIPTHTSAWNYWFNGAYGLVFLFGGLTGLSAIPRLGGLKSTVGKGLLYTSMGLLFYGIGQFFWLWYNLTGKEVPYPSIADLFFVLLMPLLLLGVWHITLLFTPRIKPLRIFEFILLTIIILTLTMIFVNRPDIGTDLDLLTNMLNIYYPFADAVIFSVSIVALRVVGGRFNVIVLFISAGALLHACADILFTHSTTVGTYWNGDLSDLLFSLGGFAVSIGIITLISLFSTTGSNAAPATKSGSAQLT